MYKIFIILLVLLSFVFSSTIKYKPITYKKDSSFKQIINKKIKGSHLKVYMPSLPYFNIISLVNGTLVRLSNTKTGWEYYLAKAHKKIDELTYDFELRKDIKFQDGTPFDANSVVRNIKEFLKGPFLYSDIHNSLKSAEKINKYKVRLHLNKPYGMLLNDLCVINFYTKKYYEKYKYIPSLTAQNTKGTGPYGAGAYMIVKGFATGLEQSNKIVLKANPYYFKKNKPYIEKITIFTKLPIKKVIDDITNYEGKLDIALIPFDKKTEIVNSKYAKLISKPSNTTFSVHMNLLKKDSKLKDIKIRQALNDALNQEKLIKFTFKNEAVKSPFILSPNAYYSENISKKYLNRKSRFSKEDLTKILNGLNLKVITQDRFMFIWKGIEYQLSKYGVKLNYTVTSDEKYVLKRLLKNREFNYDWDLLIWSTDDWNGHPWTGFFTLYTGAKWTSLHKEDFLYNAFQELFKLDINDKTFQQKVNKLLLYTYNKAYTLVLPSPNVVMALNKEVVFEPSSMAIFPLWNAKITPYHWSIRKTKELPKNRLEHLYPIRYKNE